MKKVFGFMLLLAFVASTGLVAQPKSVRQQKAQEKKQRDEQKMKQKQADLKEAKRKKAELESQQAAAKSAQEQAEIKSQITTINAVCYNIQGEIYGLQADIDACDFEIRQNE